MGKIKHSINSIATALFLGVWFSSPVMGQTQAVADRLDLLFEQLLTAEPDEVERIEGQILTEWGKSGSAAFDLLLRRGQDAIEDGQYDVAVEHFTALVDHAPGFPEGYHGRATAYYNLGLYGPAIDDLRQTLVLEPRHFGAMIGVALMLEEFGNPQDALEVWAMVDELSPADQDVDTVIERLNTKVAGESL